MNANIAALLESRAREHPSRLAIVDRGRRHDRVAATYGELAERVARLSEGLAHRGVRPGDRVLLFVPMSLDLYVALLAVLHLGAEAVFVDAWSGRSRIDAAIAAASPRAWIGTPRAQLLRLTSAAVRRIPVSIVAGGMWPLRRVERAAVRSAASVSPESAALVTFTTGSTGRPKAAARSHGFLLAQHRALSAHLDLNESDVDMPTLPVFVLNNLAMGITSVIAGFDPRRPSDIDPARIVAEMREEGVTSLVASPAFCESIAHFVQKKGDTLPLRRLFTGGAPVLPPLLRTLARVMPSAEGGGARASVIYGSTEAEPIAGIDVEGMLQHMERGPSGVTRPGLCAGAPVDHITVRIVRAHDGPIALDERGWSVWETTAGDVGEIVVVGDHVLRGYLNDPASDAENKIRDGDNVWHRTGDAGYLDDEGTLWLMGRVGQRVVRADGTWWPLEAELRAFCIDGVIHAAYFAAGATRLAVLCLEVREGCDHASMEQAVRREVFPWPIDRFCIVDAIPRDPRHHSKTDYAALSALLGL